jgi:hypothetical protein
MDGEWLAVEVQAAFIGWTGKLPNDLYGVWIKFLQVVKLAGRNGVTLRNKAMQWLEKAGVSVDDLARMMEAAGPNIVMDGERIIVCNWRSHQQDTTNAERQARWREKQTEAEVTLHNENNANRTGQDNTEKKKKQQGGSQTRRVPVTLATHPLPPGLDDADMKTAWSNWIQARREKGKPITDTAARQQLSDMQAMGRDRALAALKHSTAGNYQGLYEPRSNGPPGDSAKPVRLSETHCPEYLK